MFSKEQIEVLKLSCLDLLKGFSRDELSSQIKLLEKDLSKENAWDQQELAKKWNRELAEKLDLQNQLTNLEKNLENLEVALEIDDQEELKKLYQRLSEEKEALENQKYLNGRFDNQGVVLNVHAGAGGVDAEDWAGILFSMYQSFAKKMGWQATIIGLSVGDEGGLKSGTLEIKGQKAYGLLKEEAGVHRLVRLSPFNSSHTRETSFSLIEATPDSVADEVETPQIKPEDIKWDTFMSGGKGGQGVNTTYSAVRLTHLPTGITVVCQNERNQIQNRHIALKYLANKLAILELKKQQELKNEVRGEFHSAEWGNQIRNYVLHPYKLVKDGRSGWETTDVESVLGGDILPIIWSVKRIRKNES